MTILQSTLKTIHNDIKRAEIDALYIASLIDEAVHLNLKISEHIENVTSVDGLLNDELQTILNSIQATIGNKKRG